MEDPPGAVSLQLFGSPVLTADREDLPGTILRGRKTLALLIYLAVQPAGRPVPRDSLAYLFWPHSDDRRARNALSQSLHLLRRTLSPEAVPGDADQVWTDPARIISDVQAFRAHIEGRRFAEASDLYQGHFLEGFHVPGLPDLEEWIALERDRLRRRALDAAWKASASEERAGRLDRAVEFARRAVSLAPLEEEAARRLMALQLKRGDRAAALSAYQALAARLEQELGVEPSPETEGEVEALRTGGAPEGLRTPLAAVGYEPPETVPAGETESSPPPSAGHRDGRRRAPTWAPLAAVPVAFLLLALLLARPDGPPSLEGTLAVLPVSSDGTEPVAVATGVVELLAGSDFLRRVLPPLEPEDEDGALSRMRAEGIEALLRLDGVDGGTRASLLAVPGGDVLGAVHLPASLDPRTRVEKAAGLAAIHLDRRLDPWGPASSVVPAYGAWEAFHDGLVALREGRGQDSRRAFERAVELEPWFPLAMLELSDFGLGSSPRSDSLLESLAARRPHLTGIERDFLRLMESRRDWDLHRGYDALRALLAHLPLRFLPWTAGLAVDLGRYEEALLLADSIGLEGSIHSNPYYGPLNALHALGRHEDEWERVHALRLKHPENRIYVIYEANALGALGRLEELQALLRERGARPEPAFTFGDLSVRRGAIAELLAHGHETEARVLIEEGVRYIDSSAGENIGPLNRGRYYWWAGRLDEAEAAYRSALEEFPEWPGRYTVYRDLGLLAAERGDLESALVHEARVAALLEAPDLSPRARGPILGSRAQIHAALGRHDEAIYLLSRALASGMRHPGIREGLEFVRLRGHPDFDRMVAAPTF